MIIEYGWMMTSDYPWQEMPTFSFLLGVLILSNVLMGPFLKVVNLKKRKGKGKFFFVYWIKKKYREKMRVVTPSERPGLIIES